jgi:hypothetical protein
MDIVNNSLSVNLHYLEDLLEEADGWLSLAGDAADATTCVLRTGIESTRDALRTVIGDVAAALADAEGGVP